MAQIIKSGNLKSELEILYTSDIEQIVYVKFFNKTMENLYINAYWTNGDLHKEEILITSGNPNYHSYSQNELIMKMGDTITAQGSELIEFEIIA